MRSKFAAGKTDGFDFVVDVAAVVGGELEQLVVVFVERLVSSLLVLVWA